jgi:hypothetical protein
MEQYGVLTAHAPATDLWKEYKVIHNEILSESLDAGGVGWN